MRFATCGTVINRGLNAAQMCKRHLGGNSPVSSYHWPSDGKQGCHPSVSIVDVHDHADCHRIAWYHQSSNLRLLLADRSHRVAEERLEFSVQ